MVWFTRSSRFTILAIVLSVVLMLGLSVNVPARVQAQSRPNTLKEKLPNQWEFTPPSAPTDPVPTNREGAATRGGDQECLQGSELLTALVPASGIGETAAEYPTFSWYMPQTSASAIEFLLRDAKGNEIYRSQYALARLAAGSSDGVSKASTPPYPTLPHALRAAFANGKPYGERGTGNGNSSGERDAMLFDYTDSQKLRMTSGASEIARQRTVNSSLREPTTGVVSASRIMSLTLPAFANLSPLDLGQEYYWTLALICDPSERSRDIIAGGALKRVKSDPTLALRIQQATPEERVALYADARLWYETLNTLVELRRDRPNNDDLIQAWEKLLKSVGLDAISQKLGSRL